MSSSRNARKVPVGRALLALALACAAAPATALPLVSLDLDADVAGIQTTRFLELGEEFDVIVLIEDVAPGESLVGFQLVLGFAATLLEPLAALAGDFLLSPLIEIPSLGSGSVSLVAASQAAGAASGGGVLALLTFEATSEVLNAGITPIDFASLILSAPLGVSVAHTTAGGQVQVPEPAPAAPLALAIFLAWRRRASPAP